MSLATIVLREGGSDAIVAAKCLLRKSRRHAIYARWPCVSEDRFSAEMKSLMVTVLGRRELRLYDLRHHVTQQMKDAGLPHLELRYLTGHACRDILNVYTSVKPGEAMRSYFATIRPLIQAVVTRAGVLGIR
jgi:hypothetical protein